MIDIALNGIEKAFGGYQILRGVSFEIKEGERVALHGVNGAGKSTIIKIIKGLEEYDKGNIFFRKGITVGYLKQEGDYDNNAKVADVINSAFHRINILEKEIKKLEKKLSDVAALNYEEITDLYGSKLSEYEALGGYDKELNVEKVCEGLKIERDHLERYFNTLSGGERTRIMLAKILLEHPDTLLLDEPTNHLDIDSVEWLEEFLNAYSGSVLIVSHDRYFLDRVVNRVVELEYGVANYYVGNYSEYVKEKDAQFEREFEDYKNIQKKIKAMKKAAERFRIWGRINTDNAAHMARAKKLEAKIEELQQIQKPKKIKELNLQINQNGRSGKISLSAKDVSKSFPNNSLIIQSNFTIEYGERVALIGKNGSGKSTIFNLALGKDNDFKGEISFGSRVNIGYVEQNIEFEKSDLTIIDLIRTMYPISEGEARNLLAKYLFYRDDVFKKVEALSGGEKVRLKLCILLQQDINFLLLDEPTNHLDISAKEAIEEALKTFKGTIFFISHDRYFIDQIASRTLSIENKRIKEYLGNYSYFYEKRKKAIDERTKPIKDLKDKSEFLESKKERNEITKLKQEISKLEEKIEENENKVTDLQAEILKTGSDYERAQEIHSQIKEIQKELSYMYKEWEERQSEDNGR